MQQQKSTFIVLCKLFLYALLLLQVIRIVFYAFTSPKNYINAHFTPLLKSQLLALRFDVQLVLYLLLPIFFIWLVHQIISFFNKSFKFTAINKPLAWCYALIFTAYTLLAIVEIFYYNFFTARFNVLIFGLEQDSHVWQSIAKDFPVIKVLVFTILLFILHFYLLRKFIFNSVYYVAHTSFFKQLINVVSIIFIYFIGIRGTLTTFPLNEADANFSQEQYVNDGVKNPILTLQNAFEQKKLNVVNTDTLSTLKKFDIATYNVAVQNFNLGRAFASVNNLYDTIKVNQITAAQLPNIVVLQMESMSNYYLNLQSSKCNVLGALEKELPYLNIFRHCLSMRNGTHSALDFLLTGCLMADVSKSEFYKHTFTNSISSIYKKMGYNTTFVTGNNLGWNSLYRSLANQKFDKVVGQAELQTAYTKSPMHEYGVQDEIMFDYILNNLQQKSNGNFIYGMSISNHSPYQIPENYTPSPMQINGITNIKNGVSATLATKNLLSYQYANNCLGIFLNKLRNSPLGNNTIVVFTGDHNSKAVLEYDGELLFQRNAVPIGFYIPQKYKPANIDTSIFASQTDVLPSILHLTTNRVEFKNLGQSMFAETNNPNKHYAINFDDRWFANQFGLIDFSNNPVYYTWLDNAKTKVQKAQPIKMLEQKVSFTKSFFATSIITTQKEILATP